jgi:hypothetical protein
MTITTDYTKKRTVPSTRFWSFPRKAQFVVNIGRSTKHNHARGAQEAPSLPSLRRKG